MSSPTLDGLADAYTRVSSLNDLALDRFIEVGRQFRRQGIDCLVLKGADLISRLYGAKGIRPMADVDLLVREADLVTIDTLLMKSGFTRMIDGNPAYRAVDHSLLLDLTSDIWYLDRPGLAGIWNRSIQRVVKGLPIHCMHTDDLALFLTAYAVIHRGACTMQFAQDLARISRLEPVDWECVCREAVSRNVKIPLYHGFLSALRLHPHCAIPQSVLARLRPDTRAEQWLLRFLRAVVTDKPLYGVGHLLMLLTQPAGRRWRRLKHILFPSNIFLGYRYGRDHSFRPAYIRVTRLLTLFAQSWNLGWRILARWRSSVRMGHR